MDRRSGRVLHAARFALESDPLLPGHKGKPLAQFQQERLQIANDRRLQIRLSHRVGLRQTEKVEHLLAVGGPFLAALQFLNNLPSDEPVGQYAPVVACRVSVGG